MTVEDEPDEDCYTYHFSSPPRGGCVCCRYYDKCKELWDIEIEEEEIYAELEEW